jgi:molecular chaperone GrpE
MTTDELHAQHDEAADGRDPEETTEEVVEVDDALLGQVTEESQGDVRVCLEWLQDQLAQTKEDRLRALAELRNNQRRASENEVRVIRASVAGALRSILTVLDQMDLALAQSTEGMSAQQFAQGVQLARDEFIKTLEDLGAKIIEPSVGDEFDPQRHEAMLQQSAEGIESGHITMVMQPGFSTELHVLRAAKVAVAP